jgi:HSP20 family protein
MMAIVKYPIRNASYSPWRDLDEVSNRLARLFDDTALRRGEGTLWVPAVSVSETADELVFTAELPGMTEDQVTIELENDVLTIGGEKAEERTEGDEERKYHLWERSYGSFRRSFSLPRAVSADHATAHFDKGVLEIRLPKTPEAKGRKIEISKS